MVQCLTAHMMHLLSGSEAVEFDLRSLTHFAYQKHLLGTITAVT